MSEAIIQDGGHILGDRGTTVSFTYAFTGDYSLTRYYKGGLPYSDSSHKMESAGGNPGLFPLVGPYGYVNHQTYAVSRGEDVTTEVNTGITKVVSWAFDVCYGSVDISLPANFPGGHQIYLPYYASEIDYWNGVFSIVTITGSYGFISWQPDPTDGTTWISGDMFDRASGYQPDYSWQFVDGSWQWVDLPDLYGGGRYRNNVVVFAIDANGKGNIKYA